MNIYLESSESTEIQVNGDKWNQAQCKFYLDYLKLTMIWMTHNVVLWFLDRRLTFMRVNQKRHFCFLVEYCYLPKTAILLDCGLSLII